MFLSQLEIQAKNRPLVGPFWTLALASSWNGDSSEREKEKENIDLNPQMVRLCLIHMIKRLKNENCWVNVQIIQGD